MRRMRRCFSMPSSLLPGEEAFCLLASPVLSSNHFPGGFPLSPSLSGIGSIRFAFVVRLEPQDPTTRFEGARCPTVGTFYQLDAAVQNPLEFDGTHPGNRALG